MTRRDAAFVKQIDRRLDVAMAAGKGMAGPQVELPRCLLERCNAGHLGKKTGQDFHDHDRRVMAKACPARGPESFRSVWQASAQALAKSYAATVDEGIVADADLADAGVIYGTGFAPITGGPLNYLKQQGG